jgi:hypothetical protein
MGGIRAAAGAGGLHQLAGELGASRKTTAGCARASVIFEGKKARYFHSGPFWYRGPATQSSISRPLNKRLIISIEKPR